MVNHFMSSRKNCLTLPATSLSSSEGFVADEIVEDIPSKASEVLSSTSLNADGVEIWVLSAEIRLIRGFSVCPS